MMSRVASRARNEYRGIRRLVVWAALTLTTAVPLAAQPDSVSSSSDRFTEIPGVRERSGRMIVKPRTAPAGGLSAMSAHGRQAHRQRLAAARARLTPGVIRHAPRVDEYIVAVPSNTTEQAYAAALLATGDYEYVEPDWRVFMVETTPNDPAFGNQWHLDKIGAPAAWDSLTGTALTVAIVDTGCDSDHPDLRNLYVPGLYQVDGDTQEESYAGEFTDDTQGHGTHVAGCAAAQGNNGIGVAGVGWNFSIMPVKISNDGNALLSDLLDGARWAADHGAKVINVSYSGVGAPAIRIAADYIQSQGALLLWAAGNDGVELGPWDHVEYVVVGASNSSDTRASFSNYGMPIDVVAPGTNIYSSTRGGGYGYASGTSMASPIAAGATALIWSAQPTMLPEQMLAVLYGTTVDIGDPGEDDVFGHGRIDVAAGVLAALDFEPQVNLTVSSWPVNGVFVNVGPIDLIGDGSGFTPMAREYYNGTSVALQALAAFDGRPFSHWDLNGVAQPAGQQALGFVADTHVAATARFAIDVAVDSVPPGAVINVSPDDLNGAGGAVTPFDRQYAQAEVTFTASAEHAGHDFFEWRVAGVPQDAGPSLAATLPDTCTVEAIFGESFDLAVSAQPVGAVEISATSDRRGDAGGQTPLARLYLADADVTLTAPTLAEQGGVVHRFAYWTIDAVDGDIDEQSIDLVMADAASAVANYLVAGDLNCSGAVNNADIDPFILAITDPESYVTRYPDCDLITADVNGDGAVNFADIDPFVAVLTE